MQPIQTELFGLLYPFRYKLVVRFVRNAHTKVPLYSVLDLHIKSSILNSVKAKQKGDLHMYGIHRTEKRNRSSVYGLQIEANRTQDDHLKGLDFKGSDIDWSKTNSNVFLIKNDNWNKSITDTLEKYNIKVRKNSIVMLDSIYTASSEFLKTNLKMKLSNTSKPA